VAGWNYADIYEGVAAAVPDRPAQIHGELVQTWAELDRRANAVAADLLAAGLGEQAKVAAYLTNGTEYLEVYLAAFKAGLVPVNTNYRYGPEEIRYLFDNADAEAVVFHASFADVIDKVRDQLPRVRRWYVVADESGAGPEWAVPYADALGDGPVDRVVAPWGRSGDQLLLLYTGGTTGLPKGVMWRQDDLFLVLGGGGNSVLGLPPAADLDELIGRIDASQPGAVSLICCPLMHGTGQFTAFNALVAAGAVATLTSRHFDVEEVWTTAERRKAASIVIVGQAFSGPMLEHLDANPGRYDLSSVMLIVSSGVMWSHDNKAGLLRHMPQAILFDSLGSSEAVGLAASISAGGAAADTARFQLGPNCAVLTTDGRRVEPGSGEQGMLAVGGYLPVGYYKDQAKSAATFRVVDGRRWSIPGDWAEVAADGTVRLLGRGSVCINSGGEKIFPEEVEEVLKTHPAVRDAVCVGVPDVRFGEAICAVVEPEDDGAADLAAADLPAHVRTQLASFKVPRHVVVVDTIARAPNGKVDYKRLKALAAARVATG
jgi:3-oxocholest-4-en-26-oate---CoA ligase